MPSCCFECNLYNHFGVCNYNTEIEPTIYSKDGRPSDCPIKEVDECEAEDCVSRKNILESLNGAFPSTDWNKALFRKIVLDSPSVYPKSDKLEKIEKLFTDFYSWGGNMRSEDLVREVWKVIHFNQQQGE